MQMLAIDTDRIKRLPTLCTTINLATIEGLRGMFLHPAARLLCPTAAVAELDSARVLSSMSPMCVQHGRDNQCCVLCGALLECSLDGNASQVALAKAGPIACGIHSLHEPLTLAAPPAALCNRAKCGL